MPKLTHTKRTAVAGLAMTGAVIGAVHGASADGNNIDDLNQQLQSLVKNAERVGLKIAVKETKTYDTNVSALTGIKQEATRVQKAITHIENLNKTILSNIGKFEKQGVKFDGIKVIEIDATNVDDINKKLKNIETQFKSATEAQSVNNKRLQDAIKSVRNAGVIVEEKDAVNVPINQLDETVNQMIKELQDAEKSQKDIQLTYQKALSDWEKTVTDGKAKVESDYVAALAAWDKEVSDGRAKVEKEYQDAFSSWEAQVADGKAKVEKEYQDALAAWNKEVTEGRAKIEKEYQDALTAWEAQVADGKSKVEKEYQDALTAWEAQVADGKSKVEKEYQDALTAWEARVTKEKSDVDTRNVQSMKQWETTVSEGKAKVEKEYQDALTKWNATVEAGKSKIESEYNTALATYNAEVDKVKRQNDTIRQQNEATKEAFKNAVAKLSTTSTATKVGDNYQQTLKQRVSETSSGQVTITAKDGITIVSAELVGPNGFKEKLTVTNNAVNYRNDRLTAGEYTLNYQFKSIKNTASDVTSNFIVTTPDKIGSGSGSATFTTKAPMTTNTENQIEPLITDHVYDYSSSYAGKVKDSLRLSKKIIEANKNPQSKHILQLYPDNYGQTSYHASGKSQLNDTKGISSKLLSKQEALEIIDRLLAINAPSEKNPTYQNYGAYFQGLANAMGAHRYIDEAATGDIPFEEIVGNITKPTDTISVIQYTDGWMDKGKPEEMDRSFATWAKGRAKTFMSVVNRNQVTDNDTNSMRSIEQMTALGHPNIYDMTGKDANVVTDEVVRRFMETATVRVKAVKGENQTAHIVLGGDGVTVTKAVLKGGGSDKQLTIRDGKVDVSEKLPDGNYTVEFAATGNGNLKYQITIDGKNTIDKTVAVTGSSKGATSKETKTDSFEPVAQGKLIPELPIPQNKPVKGEYKEPPKPVKGEYKEPPKPIPEVYREPEKPVKGEYKEPPKPVKGEYKEPEKPVKGEYKESEKPVKGEYKEPPKPIKGEYKEPLKPIKGEYKEPEKPKVPDSKRVELKKIQVTTEKPELKVKELETHKVSVKPKELPKTGDASGIVNLFGLGSIGAGLLTLVRKRRER